MRIRKRKEDREKGKVCVFLLVLWHGQAALQGFHVRIEIPKSRKRVGSREINKNNILTMGN